MVEYTEEQKESAVKELLLREKTVKDIADDRGVDRVTLYNWKSQQLGKEAAAKVKPRIDLPNDKESLEMEVNRLKEQIHRLELEKDILEKTTDIIKKDPGINPKKLTNKEKTEVIDAKLIRSMSRKGCSPDNSACEGFFGRLKNEMFYCNSWLDVTIDSFINLLDRYIKWYNEKRIKKSLGGLSPYEYRQKLGLIA